VTRARLLPVLTLIATLARAQGVPVPSVPVEKRGPAIGETVPDFEAIDQFGKRQSLSALMRREGLVLLFVRSADW